LVEKLNFNWDEVHDVAEQLEHIQSSLLIEKLDAFLGYPKADPHGHPIPDRNGKIHDVKQVPLSVFAIDKNGTVRSVQDASPTFLQYLSKIGVHIGASIRILEKIEFDGSLEVMIDNTKKVFISREAAENLLITDKL
jgi:DtxR family Mn-dependent transcriptional regulator